MGFIGVIFLPVFSLLAFVSLSTSGWATTFANRPLGAVVQEATMIVRGKVRSTYSDWGQGAHQKAIFTYTDFEVTEALKGPNPGARILLRQPGGTKDDMEMSVPGTASFSTGEDVVVFLAPKDPSDQGFDVLNFTAGKYNIVSENNETYLVNSLGGGEVYDPGRGDAKSLSYNSRFSIAALRKIIKGEGAEEAGRSQFKAEQAMSGQLHDEQGHAHPSATAVGPAIAPPSTGSPGAMSEADNRSLWIPLSFLCFFMACGIGLWIFSGKKPGDS